MQIHFFGSAQGVLEILFDISDAWRIKQKCPTFEVMIEAAVVEVDRADNGLGVVAYTDLGMDQPRCVFIYFYTC